MPRNGSGGYSPPQNSWNPAINGMGALPNDWMAILNDMAAAIQASIAADGQTPITGSLNFGNNRLRNVGAPQGQGDGLRLEQIMKGADIPSAETIAFPIEGSFFEITGTTTITTIAPAFMGRTALVRFTDVLTLTNGTNLQLPGGANITTQAGDFAVFLCTDAVKWVCWLYPRVQIDAQVQPAYTDHYGPTAPTTTWPGMTWADSGTNTLWRRNAADDGWVNEGTIFKRALPEYALADIPATDKGPIYGIGAGNMEWRGAQYEGVAAAIQSSHKNLKGSATGTNAHVLFSADQIVVEAANKILETLRTISLDINSATVGANGLDAGTIAASTWYSVWVISDGAIASGLLSLSETAPTLPSGYTHKARLGWIRTDGTANKYPMAFKQAGNRSQWVVAAGTNSALVRVMATGAQGSTTVPTWVPVGVSSFVPPTASHVTLFLSAGNSSGGVAICAPSTAYGVHYSVTIPCPMAAYSPGVQLTNIVSCDMALESSNVYYAAVAGGMLACLGWEDNL